MLNILGQQFRVEYKTALFAIRDGWSENDNRDLMWKTNHGSKNEDEAPSDRKLLQHSSLKPHPRMTQFAHFEFQSP